MQHHKWWRHRWTDGLSRGLGCINSAAASKSESFSKRNEMLLKGLHELWKDLFEYQSATGSRSLDEFSGELSEDRSEELKTKSFQVFSPAFADQWLDKHAGILEDLDEHEQCHFYESQKEMVELFFDRPSTTRLAMYGTLRRGESNHHIVSGIDGTWCTGSMSGSVMQYEGYPVFTWSQTGESIPVEILESEVLQTEFGRIDEFEGKNYLRILVPVAINADKNELAYTVASTYAFRNEFQSLENP